MRMQIVRAHLVALLVLSSTFAANAREVQGMSIERLTALGDQMRDDVSKGRIPGVVIVVTRNGRTVHSEVIGMQDPATQAPMREDSIFRIYSMTKPFVSVATMMLVEEGRLMLTDPVTKYIPELKGLKVGIEKTDAAGMKSLDLVPAGKEMTIHDLLRHTSGITYGIFGNSLVKDEYKKLNIGSREQTNAEMIAGLAKVPLQFQPGTTWDYSLSTDVLGHVLERISGQPLDAYLAERLFKPLGMKDTAFWIEPSKQARVAEPFAIDPDSKAKVSLFNVRTPPKWLSGGGGAVSTASDYLRFCQMLLNGGEIDGVRILSRKTVEFMMADHSGAMRAASLQRGVYIPGPGHGFGLGFAVRTEPGDAIYAGSVGAAQWYGLGGTDFWIDPKEKLIVIWMAQAPNQRAYYRGLLRSRVYGAMMN